MLWQQVFLHSGADDFPFRIPFKRCFKIVLFPLGHRDPSDFGTAICVAVVSNSFMFSSSVFAARSVMAASRFLAAAAKM